MVSRRPVSWFLTESGRRFSFAVVTGCGLAFTTVKFAPHTFLLYKYKEYVHYYSDGKPVDLPKEIRERYQKCLDLLNVSEVHKKLIAPFSVFGYDLFHAGSISSKFGVALGIPVNFTYKSLEDLENHDIRVNQSKIDWTSENGKKLADALILPDNVQKFAICREILMTQNNKVFYESTYPFICVFIAYNFTQYINRRLNLYAAPTYIRATLYSLVGFFSLGTYFLMKDMTEVHYEAKADQELCKLGLEFIESGVIFYEKLLQRNQALRELMGREGERKYSKLGNENFFLRQPRIALMHRKEFFEQNLKEYKKEEVPDEVFSNDA